MLRIGAMKTMETQPHSKPLDLGGVKIYPAFVGAMSQTEIIDDLRQIICDAPLFSPQTPYGKPMSVGMTSSGKYGWYSDQRGYRYVDHHPFGNPWPKIPDSILKIWAALGDPRKEPDCCLINFYGETAKMGLHQDKDEKDFSVPVVSVSLGDDGLFRVGGTSRGGQTRSAWLKSGDVAVLGGEGRMIHHGVDKIRFRSSGLLKHGGRINLTLRVVD